LSSACPEGAQINGGRNHQIWHFLRLLYVKLGVQHCVHDGQAVQAQTPESIVAQNHEAL
jgi:excinuclease ABC subunit A